MMNISGIINTIRPGHEIFHKIIIDNILQSILVKATEFKFDKQCNKTGFFSGYHQ